MRLLRRAPPLQGARRHQLENAGAGAIKHVRDRGFDHVVDRERHLKLVLAIKHLIKREPSKSLPLSVIAQQNDSLRIPIRPIEFIRKYPTIFEEYRPGDCGIRPHIRLTSQVLDIDSEEQLVYQSENYKQGVADRLMKFLMISCVRKLPMKVLNAIEWDLGLPRDFARSLVPEFPDYFRVIKDGHFSSSLELVCWNNQLATSFIEKTSQDKKTGYQKGMPISFPMQFHVNFEMDRKFKLWIDEWQKLTYVSPYENALHLESKTDESDKWVVGILHEMLNLFVSKKVERDTLLGLCEWLGIRSRAKQALLRHPGIFYVSSKIGTHTVLLKEAYKRGSLVEMNPLVDIRHRYVHLMNKESGKASRIADTRDSEVIKGNDCEDDDFENADNVCSYSEEDDNESAGANTRDPSR